MEVSGVFLTMGMDIAPLAEAPAGSLVAVSGLSRVIHRSATLASDPRIPELLPLELENVKAKVRELVGVPGL